MNAERDPQETRITALEELAAYQSHTIDELSTELANQWKIIDQMQLKLDRLMERFSAIEQSTVEAPDITRPPHY